ncbi:MAG TPA: GTP-dependent dephospho-CoA kinase family protein [Methanoregulaceae archaeon]|nr:GTP-dependent dephospho-CoA kinase family protein [Methanoregulaceae archaeon]
MLVLPEDKRHYFKTPFGRLFPDIIDVIPHIRGCTVYTVGDVVTYHIIQNGIVPDLAVIDGHTMREPCNRSPAVFTRRINAHNPPGSLTDEMIDALNEAVKIPPVLLLVEGEEDLAVIPLVLCAPPGTVILYGQPGEGVVVCRVDDQARKKAEEMLSYFVSFEEK